MAAPYSTYATCPADAVHIEDELVGISTRSSYTVNVGGWSSLAMVDERYAVDGTEVTVERHAISEVRAVLST